MRTSKVKQIWNEGGLALGTLIKSIDPVHSEALSQMDFDFLWFDLEHSEKSVETFCNLARATRVGDVDVLARPARWEYMRMGRIMEAGATGIMYPRCESVEEAKEVIRFSKFFPIFTELSLSFVNLMEQFPYIMLIQYQASCFFHGFHGYLVGFLKIFYYLRHSLRAR